MITTNQLPSHTHTAQANNGGTGVAVSSPAGAFWNKWSGAGYATSSPDSSMDVSAIGAPAGTTANASSHQNMPPYLAINFIISLFGIFPSQN